MREHSTPEKECLQRIADIAVGYDGNADRNCERGSMKGLCGLIDEMNELAGKGLRGEWPGETLEIGGNMNNVKDEKAWVIEQNSPRPKNTVYLSVDGNVSSRSGRFIWQENPHQALRFSREIDAKLFVYALITLSEHIPHSKTLKGLREGDMGPFVVEHIWVNP